MCVAGAVLTGGAARLPFLTEVAESTLRKPTRLASPIPIAKLPAALAEPEFSATIGMALYGYRARLAHGNQGGEGLGAKLKSLFARRGA
jgi:cell division ATPase FtsA